MPPRLEEPTDPSCPPATPTNCRPQTLGVVSHAGGARPGGVAAAPPPPPGAAPQLPLPALPAAAPPLANGQGQQQPGAKAVPALSTHLHHVQARHHGEEPGFEAGAPQPAASPHTPDAAARAPLVGGGAAASGALVDAAPAAAGGAAGAAAPLSLTPSSALYCTRAESEAAARNVLGAIFKRIADNPQDRHQVRVWGCCSMVGALRKGVCVWGGGGCVCVGGGGVRCKEGSGASACGLRGGGDDSAGWRCCCSCRLRVPVSLASVSLGQGDGCGFRCVRLRGFRAAAAGSGE